MGVSRFGRGTKGRRAGTASTTCAGEVAKEKPKRPGDGAEGFKVLCCKAAKGLGSAYLKDHLKLRDANDGCV